MQDEFTQEPQVFFRRLFIGAAPEEVWEWLLEPERVEQYSLTMLEARPRAAGDPIRYLHRLTWQPVVSGVVEELVDARRLVHTYEMQLPEPDPVSRVTLELLRYGEGICCLELLHEGLYRHTETFNSVSRSWDVLLSSLKTVIETGKPLPWPSRRRG